MTAAIAVLLVWGGVQLVGSEREAGGTIGPGIPTWIAQAVLPLGLALIAARIVWRASPSWRGRLLAASGIVAAVILWRSPALLEFRNVWPGLLLVLAAGVFGPRSSRSSAASPRCCF